VYIEENTSLVCCTCEFTRVKRAHRQVRVVREARESSAAPPKPCRRETIRIGGSPCLPGHPLNAIFNEIARRAAINIGERPGATEIYLRLGLKAQAQYRAAAQTLFEMKNPQPGA
jgi:hypothetical protein